MAKGKGGSKALTGILCFISGFLFALIIEVALIGGAVYLVLYTDIDKIFEIAGQDNVDDEGNNIYINTDEAEGGVKNVLGLITAVKDLAGKGGNLTIGEVENLLPVTNSLIDKIYSELSSALSSYNLTESDLRKIIDEDELKSTKISELGQFFSRSVKKTEVSTVLRIAGIDPETNAIYLSVAYGAEASVIFSDTGADVLYKDVYTYSDGSGYVRSDGAVLPEELVQYLVARANGTEYELYYSAAQGSALVAAKAEDGTFSLTADAYALYSADTATLSGGYYYDGQDNLVVVYSRTVGDLLDGEDGILSALDDVYVTDLLAGEGGEPDEMLVSVFEGVTVGDLMSGNVAFDDLLSKIHMPEIIDVTPSDAIMMYIGYSISDVEAAEENEPYEYTGVINFYELAGDEWVLSDTRDCFIVVGEDGVVSRVYYLEGNAEVDYSGVAVPDIGAQTANVQNALYVKDVIDIDPSDKLMTKLGEYKLGEIGNAIDELYVSDFVTDVNVTDSPMAYIAYGISGIETAPLGSAYDYTATYHYIQENTVTKEQAYIVAENGVIVSVYWVTENPAECYTLIGDISTRIDGLMNDLTLGEIIDISPENTILYALSDSTINSLSADIEQLSIQQLFASDIYGKDAPEIVEESEFTAEYIYYTIAEDGEFVLAGNGGKLTQWQEGIYTYGSPTGAWKLLLYSGSEGEMIYTVNDVVELQMNVLNNLKTFTISQLAEIGVIEGTFSEEIGNMTIQEAVNNLQLRYN